MEPTDFLELFISEAREHIEGQAALLARARTEPLERDAINDLFRHAHSIKGMAAAMAFTPMSSWLQARLPIGERLLNVLSLPALVSRVEETIRKGFRPDAPGGPDEER